MLPRGARLTGSEDIRRAVRQGVRVGRPTLVVHAVTTPGQAGVRTGFVVSKAVGNAVVRNRVKRRLRHLVVAHLSRTPVGTDLVIRALPKAAADPSAVVNDLSNAWDKAIRRLSPEIAGRTTT